jgi:hypothetical protein
MQHDSRGNCSPIDHDTVDCGLAFCGKVANCRGDKAPKLLVIGRSGTGPALPAPRFERQKIVKRSADGGWLGGGGDQDGADLGQASPPAPEFLLLVSAYRTFDVKRPLVPGRQERPLVAIEIGDRHLRTP